MGLYLGGMGRPREEDRIKGEKEKSGRIRADLTGLWKSHRACFELPIPLALGCRMKPCRASKSHLEMPGRGSRGSVTFLRGLSFVHFQGRRQSCRGEGARQALCLTSPSLYCPQGQGHLISAVLKYIERFLLQAPGIIADLDRGPCHPPPLRQWKERNSSRK